MRCGTILLAWLLAGAGPASAGPAPAPRRESTARPMHAERQLTSSRRNHVLTNIGVWSPDSRWIVCDIRSAQGANFDGDTILRVNVDTGEEQVLYRGRNGACCGVVTCSPRESKVVFILGPENPTPDWSYAANRRQGVLVDMARPQAAVNLDARDLTPPFTPGALRGGTHVHVFSPDGQWVSYTYEDQVLARFAQETPAQEVNLRNVGVSVPGPVRVKRDHPRNHDGEYFSVLVTVTKANPVPGSDEIRRAFEDAWVGTNGYVRSDGSRQRRALAFQGEVVAAGGTAHAEVYVVDLPDDLTQAGAGPLEGTATLRPRPPRGAIQRRLTFTATRRFPGLQGPRHWLRSSPDGARIAFLMKDDEGVVQLWTISPKGGVPVQLTHNSTGIASAFSWSPDGRRIAHAMDGSICVTDTADGTTLRLTSRADAAATPRPEACVFSPDGAWVAYVRPVPSSEGVFDQVFVCSVPSLESP